MKKLILTVGLPRSGKSTWARKQGHPIVNPDSIRLALHGEGFIASAEPFVWAIAYNMAKALFLAGHDTVIIDATNTTEERRYDWILKFKDLAEITYECFYTPIAACLDRAVLDGKEYLVPVINRMAATLHFPE